MAKRKQALFEVIVNAKGIPRTARAGTLPPPPPVLKALTLPSPRKWIGKLSALAERPAMSAAVPPPAREAVVVETPAPAVRSERRTAGYSAAPSMSFARDLVQPPPVDLKLPKPRPEKFSRPRHTAAARVSPMRNIHVSLLNRFRLPQDRHTLMLAGIALTLLVSVTILIGRLINRHNRLTALGSAPTSVIRQGPIANGVLDPHHHPFAPVAQQARSMQAVPVDSQSNEPAPPAGLVVDGSRRMVNFNYIVLQSFATSEEKQAMEARDFLNTHGIGCSLETNIKSYPSRLVLLSTSGFKSPYTATPEFQKYAQNVQKLSAEYTAMPHKGHRPFSAGNAIKWQ